jgi:hypothetical protein
MKIQLDANPDDAPGCVKILRCDKIGIDQPAFGDDDGSILVQTDYYFCGVASTFGWSPALLRSPSNPTCDHKGTDGTVDCPQCKLSVVAFIMSAREWIDNHDGMIVEDPGYFE